MWLYFLWVFSSLIKRCTKEVGRILEYAQLISKACSYTSAAMQYILNGCQRGTKCQVRNTAPSQHKFEWVYFHLPTFDLLTSGDFIPLTHKFHSCKNRL